MLSRQAQVIRCRTLEPTPANLVLSLHSASRTYAIFGGNFTHANRLPFLIQIGSNCLQLVPWMTKVNRSKSIAPGRLKSHSTCAILPLGGRASCPVATNYSALASVFTDMF